VARAARREAGLDDEQVQRLRAAVSAGRRPRVQVSGGQFPAGTTGTVLRVGEQQADGGEYVTVRVKVGSVTDELRFSPRELALPGRATAAAPRNRATHEPAPKPAPAPAPVRDPAPAPQPVPARRVEPKRPRRVAGASVPAVSITITSSGSSWSVNAQRGARTVVKNSALAPGVVAAVAALIGDAAVEESVAAVNDAALGEAQARAEQLRAELAEVEAVLTSHRRP
jgi:hypothetical protein